MASSGSVSSAGLCPQMRVPLGLILASVIFAGGLARLVATLLLKFSGGASWVLALYLIVMAAISLVSIYLIAETRQVDLSDPYVALDYSCAGSGSGPG